MMIVVRCVTVTLEDNINLPQPPHLVTANSRGLAEAGQEGGPLPPKVHLVKFLFSFICGKLADTKDY